MRFEAYNAHWLMNYAWHTRAITHVFDVCWGNEPILGFLVTGRFSWRPLGFLWPVEYSNPGGGPPPLDFVGLNYYSRSAAGSVGVFQLPSQTEAGILVKRQPRHYCCQALRKCK
jgi:hypothetical protein